MDDDETIHTATIKQLQHVYDNVDLLSIIMLDAYLEWVDGKRAWSAGNEYAVSHWGNRYK